MNSNKVSIVVPVYNSDEFLEECIESLINQTYTNLEIILVDDGSNDKSSMICDNKCMKDDRIKVFHNENHGVSYSRNFGITMSTGEYLMFVDSDDWVDDKYVEYMIGEIIKNKVDLVICGNYNVATLEKTVRHIFPTDCLFVEKKYYEDILQATIGINENNPSKLDKLTPTWARLYKKSIIEINKIEFVDLNLIPSECLQFNIEYALNSKSVYYIDKPLYFYRRNTSSSITKTYRNNLLLKWEYWATLMNKLLIDLNCDKYLWNAYYSRLCCSVIPLGGNALRLKKYKLIKNEVSIFLNNSLIIKSYNHFEYAKYALHWKVFFFLAKNRCTVGFIFLTWVMRRILDLRKK